MPIWLLIIIDVAAVGFAVFLAFKLPHDPWRITPSLVVTFLLTILLGATIDPRAFLLTTGLVAAFATGRTVYRLRQSRSTSNK
ncbi:hypothetical protein [Saccharopolyspora sp. NPDC049426]|uniref:hypothetical protein n=1 Tax=Saccharopolyspora sp. NPDC049426 TaxID=3155652 RepID=UPI0034144BAD